MTTYLLGDLKARGLERADMANSSFIGSSPELTSIVNAGLGDLYDLLVGRFEDWFHAEVTFTPDSTGNYSLPVSVYKLRGVDRDSGDGFNFQTVDPLDWADRNRRFLPSRSGVPVRYSWLAQQIRFSPASSAVNWNYKVSYVPAFVPLVGDSDSTFDIPQSWVEYIYADTAAKLLLKEESDPSTHLAMKSQVEARIMTMAAERDASTSQTLTFSRRDGCSYDPRSNGDW